MSLVGGVPAHSHCSEPSLKEVRLPGLCSHVADLAIFVLQSNDAPDLGAKAVILNAKSIQAVSVECRLQGIEHSAVVVKGVNEARHERWLIVVGVHLEDGHHHRLEAADLAEEFGQLALLSQQPVQHIRAVHCKCLLCPWGDHPLMKAFYTLL